MTNNEAAMLLAEKGRLLAVKGKYKEALVVTDQVVELYPDFAPIYVDRGSLYGMLEDIETAIREIRKGQKIFEEQENSQYAAIMKQFADDLQERLDTGSWAEELEEERRITEGEKTY